MASFIVRLLVYIVFKKRMLLAVPLTAVMLNVDEAVQPTAVDASFVCRLKSLAVLPTAVMYPCVHEQTIFSHSICSFHLIISFLSVLFQQPTSLRNGPTIPGLLPLH